MQFNNRAPIVEVKVALGFSAYLLTEPKPATLSKTWIDEVATEGRYARVPVYSGQQCVELGLRIRAFPPVLVGKWRMHTRQLSNDTVTWQETQRGRDAVTHTFIIAKADVSMSHRMISHSYHGGGFTYFFNIIWNGRKLTNACNLHAKKDED